MNFFTITLLRVWVFLMWNIQQLIEIIRKKRDDFLPITDLRIVYKKDGLLVLDKSPGLLINSINPWWNYITLQTQLFFSMPDLADFQLEHMYRFINRLDAPTSGLICVAYSQKMAGLAGRAFQNRAAKKRYLAVVWGHVDDSSCLGKPRQPRSKYLPPFTIEHGHDPICTKIGEKEYLVDFAIGKLSFTWPSGLKQKIMVPGFAPKCQRPRTAQTKVTVLKHGYLEGMAASLLLLQPQSGRRHQLRLHCAIGLGGHPIAGDLIYGRIYGDNDTQEAANYRVPRLMLHALSLDLQLIPDPPSVKGLKKQERVNRSHPQPLQLYFESSRNMLERCHWVDHAVFNKL
ncbi:unnamed protein product [Mesocestoides corti]|uniref:PseudoU_synth_2 domain-containing protein n=1 Tax=Mesocestoides corti TaxID=53468 RepID=A0A0R3UGF8_MESCO|nr:unnamed protein product [Mesocestoides corti]